MHNYSEDNDDLLTLSLSCNPPKRVRQSSPSQPIQIPQRPMVPYTASTSNVIIDNNVVAAADANVNVNAPSPSSSRPRRARAAAAQGKSETIPPPFPWATDRRATIHTRKYLLENEIFTVTGSVECKRCKTKFEMELNFENKFAELWNFMQRNKDNMHDRAPDVWVFPVLPTCEHCGRENSVQPYLAGTKKKDINWLFLFLGQMIGCCTLKQMKYLLKHNKLHRTAAKDRIVYAAYMHIFKQLVPEWFDS